MITWQQKVEAMGMVWRRQTPQYGKFRVRVDRNPGLVSFGDGETLEKALEVAALGQNIDFHGVKEKLTEAAWRGMAHL